MIDFEQKTPDSISKDIVARVKNRRKERNITQEKLSKLSNVSLGSIKRFERTGEISFYSLIKIAIVLECEDDFDQLFTQKYYETIEDVINENL